MVKSYTSSLNDIFKKAIKSLKVNYSKLRIYILVFLLAILGLLIFGKYALQPLLYVAGIIMGYYSTMFGKIVPHIAPETMTAMSIFGGLLFGSKYGFILGIVMGIIVYSVLGLIKMTTLLNTVVIASGGLYAGLLMSLGLAPNLCFLLAIVLRSITGILIFWNLTSDKVEALAHAIFDPLWNIVIYMPIFMLLFNLIN